MRIAVARLLMAVAVMITLAAGGLLVAELLRPSSAETTAFEIVYFTALLSGHDTGAALRKAHLRMDLLMRERGMSRPEAGAKPEHRGA